MEQVLYMPKEPLSVEYAVTGSSALPYINSKGILRALPEESKTIRLKVKVTSKVDKRIYAYTFVDVVLQQ